MIETVKPRRKETRESDMKEGDMVLSRQEWKKKKNKQNKLTPPFSLEP